ncbi:esterase [Thermobispora bispora]|uniref:Alpha/beta hydrolase n=1 Tax=Thermobispora bispora (strain ATCC 19993 / DSM 43833 / CBS 139.67 / JCM 10125 / KCTC 9307 / NBRC 14880 / R51) TaxID=469371 RepID=D6Y9B1_THEBD|nr:alpha/beta fold hydrolase [Thermobispora bispora]MBO2474188.1 esterase [Actinomycetales bacterium]MDI9580545.1 alpha/beta fold hydrolase [Thermobispora sp.]ADG88031.1 alpha/beta hydrolase [Thermobispora bispora DSM 43833]MBX6167681.1 alpha/beta fold hydrolase [Thermobispora bispora]QSI47899.1 alpha/beta fold hydrolase [Thermobispora bispora]
MPVLPGAEPYHHDGGPIGVLLCHGFTGSPQSLRPWGEYLAGHGLTVSLPRLPGHGTTWQEMNRTGWEDWYAELDKALAALRERCAEVFVMGLSLGGCLALRLAEVHPKAIRGVVAVNPSLVCDTPLLRLAPVLKWIVPSVRGVANDIKREGVTELGYSRTPVRAAATLLRLWRLVQRDIDRIEAPVLVFRSREDHVVGPASVAFLRSRLADRVEVRELTDSYHVATLDNDAPVIFEGSLGFIRSHASVGLPKDV